jgi:hypothetical protein
MPDEQLFQVASITLTIIERRPIPKRFAQLCRALFLTDDGIETTLIFHEGGTEFGQEYADFKRRLGHLNVMGGCCGTDHRPIEQIASACLPLFRDAT